jgi:hypothetical protein
VWCEFESLKLMLTYYVLLEFKSRRIVILNIKTGIPNHTIILSVLTGIIKNKEDLFDEIHILTSGNHKRGKSDNSYLLAPKYRFSVFGNSVDVIHACVANSSLSDADKLKYSDLNRLLYTYEGQAVWEKIGRGGWRGYFDMRDGSKNMLELRAELDHEDLGYFL